jgi:hypothetical protein
MVPIGKERYQDNMKCPRCSEEMVAYVSAPIAKRPTERRLYFLPVWNVLGPR